MTDPVVAGLGTILSVWAHPDDETFVAGGIMAAAVANGQRVVTVSFTAGERGTDDADTWPWGVYMTDDRPPGVPVADLALDVRLTGAALDQKIAALCAMRTQVAIALTAKPTSGPSAARRPTWRLRPARRA